MGKLLVKLLLRGFGGKRPCPKASWAPYNPFPSMGNHFLHKTIFCGSHFRSKKVPGPAGTLRCPNLGSGVPKIVPGVENTKVACRKTMQNPTVGIPNGAICCKLWPKTIFGGEPSLRGCQSGCVVLQVQFQKARRWFWGAFSPPPAGVGIFHCGGHWWGISTPAGGGRDSPPWQARGFHRHSPWDLTRL